MAFAEFGIFQRASLSLSHHCHPSLSPAPDCLAKRSKTGAPTTCLQRVATIQLKRAALVAPVMFCSSVSKKTHKSLRAPQPFLHAAPKISGFLSLKMEAQFTPQQSLSNKSAFCEVQMFDSWPDVCVWCHPLEKPGEIHCPLGWFIHASFSGNRGDLLAK